jgi:hypothetical protein
VFLVDVLTCGHCGGPRKLLAAIFDQDAIPAEARLKRSAQSRSQN